MTGVLAISVTEDLRYAGWSSNAIEEWWTTPRVELYGLSPEAAYERSFLRFEVRALAHRDATRHG